MAQERRSQSGSGVNSACGPGTYTICRVARRASRAEVAEWLEAGALIVEMYAGGGSQPAPRCRVTLWCPDSSLRTFTSDEEDLLEGVAECVTARMW